MDKPSQNGIRIVVYKKILEGDIGKMEERSNITDSGGGARDFRFNPQSKFRPIFMKMFPLEVPGKPDTLHAVFHWNDAPDTEAMIDIRTDKVRKEVRICQVNKCLRHRPHSAKDCIFLLVMDSDGKVWPYFTSEESLENDEWDPFVASEILKGLRAERPQNSAPAGYIDFETGTSYTNGS